MHISGSSNRVGEDFLPLFADQNTQHHYSAITNIKMRGPTRMVHPNRAMTVALILSQVHRESGARLAVEASHLKNETKVEDETKEAIPLEDETNASEFLVDETDKFIPRPSEVPTLLPTEEPTKQDTGSFRLRLHWEKGYKWQNNREELWYCTGKFVWAYSRTQSYKQYTDPPGPTSFHRM